MEDRKVVSRLSQEMCMIFRQFSPCCFMKFERLCFNRFHKFRRVYATRLCIGLECLDDCMSLVSLLVSMEVQPLQIRVHISATTTILSCPGQKKLRLWAVYLFCHCMPFNRTCICVVLPSILWLVHFTLFTVFLNTQYGVVCPKSIRCCLGGCMWVWPKQIWGVALSASALEGMVIDIFC